MARLFTSDDELNLLTKLEAALRGFLKSHELGKLKTRHGKTAVVSLRDNGKKLN
jgi:hypothetical protein